jgi:hypothetical protein
MITYRGQKFSGYNKPKRTPGKTKKFAVLAKQGDQVKLVRFGDPKLSIKKNQPETRNYPLRKTNLHARRATVQGQVVLKVKQIN